jgi:hypothetical protein
MCNIRIPNLPTPIAFPFTWSSSMCNIRIPTSSLRSHCGSRTSHRLHQSFAAAMPESLPSDDSDDSAIERELMARIYANRLPLGSVPEPDPVYFEVKDELESMCLVATSWLECMGNHENTTMFRTTIERFQITMRSFLDTLHYPRPSDWMGDRRTVEEMYEQMKRNFDELKIMVDNMRIPTSGIESMIVTSSQTTRSNSQGAPTSAPVHWVSIEAEDMDADSHHAQPR